MCYTILITQWKGDCVAHLLRLGPPLEVCIYHRPIGYRSYLGVPRACNWYCLCDSQRTDILRSYSILFGPFLLSESFTNRLTSLGCWIAARYPIERIGLQYLWMWVTAFVDILVYICLALVVKGFVTFSNGRIRINTGGERVPSNLPSGHGHDSEGGWDGTSVAFKLLFYPAVYIVTVSSNNSRGSLTTKSWYRFSLSQSSGSL